MNERTLVLLLLACSVALAGCKKPEVKSYRIPKETTAEAAPAAAASTNAAPAAPAAPAGSALPAAGAAGNSMANTAVATAAGAELTWKAPPQWTPKTGSAMRKGSYAIKGGAGDAELAITAFPGDVGGELANINRWRGQVQLPPIAAGELGAAAQRFDRNSLHFTVVDLAGGGQRMLGAIVPFGGATWFFKLGPGPDATVANEKVAFLAFLETVTPAPAAK